MQIKISPPLGFCEKGKRPVNEDSVYPQLAAADLSSRTFLVCDGVGGASKGELASQIVAETFGAEFENTAANLKNLHVALHQAQAKIDAFIYENNQHKGMATTMSFLQLNDYGAIIAHAGDSRVYQIRGNKVLFCTYDHSLVNDLIKMGKWEEAKTAKSNIITRAIQGEEIRSIVLDVQLIENIQADDYFFLCSDGVWSALPDEELLEILEGNNSEEEKMETIRNICNQYSKDNFSAYLVKVEEINSEKSVSEKIITPKEIRFENSATSFSTEYNQETTHVKVEDTREKRSGVKTFFWLFIILGLILGGFYYWDTELKDQYLLKNNTSPSGKLIENPLPLDTLLIEEESITTLEE